jgi:ABC-type multidrug transport system fused ATPase/permease subunit
MQISNNIQTYDSIDLDNLNNINIEQAENTDVQNIEEIEGISVVELSRIEPRRNFLRNNIIKICSILSVVSVVMLSVMSIIGMLVDVGTLEFSTDKSSKIKVVIIALIVICIVINIFAFLYTYEVIPRCLNKRKIQNPIIKELKNLKYKNIEQYQGNITEFCNKPSVIKLEELGSKELKDPIVYKKQLYSFKEFKKSIQIADGIVPHDKLIVEPKSIKRLKIDSKVIQEDLV